MKRTFLIAMVLVLAVAIPVSAAMMVAVPSCTLNFSGTTASCSGNVKDYGNYIDASLELWTGTTLVASWPLVGTSVVQTSGTANVAHNVTYTLKITGTSDGVTLPPVEVTKTCP